MLLAGIAFVLSTATAGRLMDDHDYDGLLVAVWTFLAGGLYGGFAYWVFGAVLYGGAARARLARLLPAQPAPARVRGRAVALSLVLWPVKLALYGDDLFHRGGADAGAGGEVFARALGSRSCVWAVGAARDRRPRRARLDVGPLAAAALGSGRPCGR